MPSPEKPSRAVPSIGVLKLDTRFERFAGDIGNDASLPYPMLMETVAGATAEKVTSLDDDSLLEPFIAAGRRLVDRGADAITTTCGFLVLYQKELAAALSVPVATSSLLQIPLAQAMLPRSKSVGVITFSAAGLGAKLLAAAGASPETPVAGLDPSSAMVQDILGRGPATTTEDRERTSLQAAMDLRRHAPHLGAVVVECTNVAPYSAAIARRLGVPVYDTITLVEWLVAGLSPRPYGGARDRTR